MLYSFGEEWQNPKEGVAWSLKEEKMIFGSAGLKF